MRALLLLLLVSLLPISCTRDQEQPAPPVVSPEKSLFDEVKERTVNDPTNANAWYHLADMYERSRMYREAADSLLKVIELDPQRGYAYMKLGNTYNRLELYQEAIKSYKKAIKFFPKNPVLHNNLAISYGKAGQIHKEIVELKKAIALRPRYATARYNLGVVLLKQGDRDGALKQYKEIDTFDEGIAAALKKEIDKGGK
jgi:tetratricopeptide (TPR) repeat protein